MPVPISTVIMRGGTSKGIFLREEDLPEDSGQRERVILAIFGSPDRRQIDGLGGADPLTSKLAIIGPPPAGAAPDVCCTYTFGQVEIDRAAVDWHSLCGNISAAVGAYAIHEGLVRITEPLTRVKIYNSNLKRHLVIEVPVAHGVPLETGGYVVPGVPGSGARIMVDFHDTAGAASAQRKLLPTGNPVDTLEVADFGNIQASLVDIGNAHVFVRAADVGLKGIESQAQIDADPRLLDLVERIRGAGAAAMGMVSSAAQSRHESPATPIFGIVSPPADYDMPGGLGAVAAQDIDLVSRLIFMGKTHKTYAGTSTVCTGVAARIPGTLVHEVSRKSDARTVRIGHPMGVIVTEIEVRHENGGPVVERATLGRTARRLMTGQSFVPEAAFG